MLALLTVITLWLTTCKQIPGQLQISHWRWWDPPIVRISLSAVFSPVLVTESHCVDNISLLVSVLHLPCVTVSPLASLPRLSQARHPAEPGSGRSMDHGLCPPSSLGPHMTIHMRLRGEMNEKCNTTQCHTRLLCIRYFSSAVIVLVFAPRHLNKCLISNEKSRANTYPLWLFPHLKIPLQVQYNIHFEMQKVSEMV